MSRSLLALLLLALLALSAAPVLAQEDDVDVADEADSAGAGTDDAEDYGDENPEDFEAPVLSHPDISTTVVFPDSTDRRFDLNEEVVVVVGFHNDGSDTFNVTAMGAHLHSPADFSYYIQNLTARRVVGAVIGPKQHTAVEYVFKADPTLEPVTYQLSTWILYNNSADRMFVNTVFNDTITFIDNRSFFDLKSLSAYGFVGAIIGVISFFFVKPRLAPKSKAARVERGTRAEEPVAIYSPLQSSKPVRRSKSASKK